MCSPVSSGTGPTGICSTQQTLPKGNAKCKCVGELPLSLTGEWKGDDGGLYYLRQIGNDLWWAGFSTDTMEWAPYLHNGLAFTNVFHGTIEAGTATGDWVDVPRGRILQNGTLTLSVSNNLISRQSATGGFGATRWTRTSSPSPEDIFTIFSAVKKNQDEWRDHSLLDNLKPAKAKPVAIFGTISQKSMKNTDPDPMHVNYLTTYQRHYDDFICLARDFICILGACFNIGGTPDGDIDFDMVVDRTELDHQTGFWNGPWETSHNVTSDDFRNKLDHYEQQLHVESIMYGGTTECGDNAPTSYLLPGWQQSGSSSILFNGVPVAGNLELMDRDSSSARVDSILRTPIAFGNRVRVTGNLVLDCGHGATHRCDEDEAGEYNQEIHPLYTLDLVQDFNLPRRLALLTGAWSNNDAGTYYLRQIGNTVWWLGMSVDEGQSFANVFRGTLQNNQISGEWADVPLGATTNAGTLTVSAGLGDLSTTLTRLAVSGGFGGDTWQKLYDVGSRTFVMVFDDATTSAAVWPSMTVAVPFEITIGSQRVEAQPTHPHRVKLPNGQQVTQVNLNTRVTIAPPRLGALPVSVNFVGYRASWMLTESDQKPGIYAQPIKAPRALPVASIQEKRQLTDQRTEATGPAGRPTSNGDDVMPELMIHYHIEKANPE